MIQEHNDDAYPDKDKVNQEEIMNKGRKGVGTHTLNLEQSEYAQRTLNVRKKVDGEAVRSLLS